jgi:pantetheine-phosphate adenylyltransferase
VTRLAIFPGSFDPLTHGHVDIIRRGLALFDRVLVAVTINLKKQPLFTMEERQAMVRASFPNEPRIEVDSLSGLLAPWAGARGACAILRGLRAPSDFEYELQMAQMNRHLQPGLDTVFLSAEAQSSFVSSSLVKEVATLGGDVRGLVPDHVFSALEDKLAGRRPA